MGRESVFVTTRPPPGGLADGPHYSPPQQQQQGSCAGSMKAAPAPGPQVQKPRDPTAIVLKKADLDQKMISSIQSEIKIAQRMKGVRHVRTLSNVSEDRETVALSFTSSGHSEVTLLEYTKKMGKLEEEEAKVLFAQLATALAYCHERMVIHRDLKLPSIFVDPFSKNVRLGDFTHSTIINSRDELMGDRRGSPAYIGPEIVIGQPYSGDAADCWSLGVVLYAMLCGAFPFVDSTPMLLFEKIIKADPVYPDDLSPQARSLLQGLLKPVPSTRLSALEALNHPWLRENAPSSPSSDVDDDDQMVPDVC